MTLPHTEERRPTLKSEAPSRTGFRTPTTGPETTTILAEPAHLLAGVYVVLVAHTTTDPTRYRRRVYLNLLAAQHAAERAARRGHPAAVVLCNLAPVHTFAGGWTA